MNYTLCKMFASDLIFLTFFVTFLEHLPTSLGRPVIVDCSVVGLLRIL